MYSNRWRCNLVICRGDWTYNKSQRRLLSQSKKIMWLFIQAASEMRAPHLVRCRNSNESLPLTSAASPGWGRAREQGPTHIPLYSRKSPSSPKLGRADRSTQRPRGSKRSRAKKRRWRGGGAGRRALGGGVGREAGKRARSVGSPDAMVGQARAAPPPLLLLFGHGPQRPRTQRPSAAEGATVAGARVPPPPAPQRRLRRRRKQLQAAPQRSPPHHPGGEPAPHPRPTGRPNAARGPGRARFRSTLPGHSLCPSNLAAPPASAPRRPPLRPLPRWPPTPPRPRRRGLVGYRRRCGTFCPSWPGPCLSRTLRKPSWHRICCPVLDPEAKFQIAWTASRTPALIAKIKWDLGGLS